MKTTYTQKSNARRAAKAIMSKFDMVKDVNTVESVDGIWVNFAIVACTEAKLPAELAERAHQFIFEPAKLEIPRCKRQRRVAKVVMKPKAKTAGIKIQKVREERNGVKRPSAGTKCAALWELFETYYNENNRIVLTPKPAKEISAKQGFDPTTTTVQLYRWREFMGF